MGVQKQSGKDRLAGNAAQAEAARLLADIAKTLAQIAQIKAPDPELEQQAHDLSALETQLQDIITGHAPSSENIGVLLQRASQVSLAAASAAAGQLHGGTAYRTEQAQVLMDNIRVHEQASRSIYNTFQQRRTTPADSAIQRDLAQAEDAYAAALKTGDAMGISEAAIKLNETRLRDLAYAVGRDDPAAAKPFSELQKKHADLLDNHAKLMASRGATPEEIKQEMDGLRKQSHQHIREAAEKGARDAGRDLSTAEKEILGESTKSEPPSQFAALAGEIEAAKPETPVKAASETEALPPPPVQSGSRHR